MANGTLQPCSAFSNPQSVSMPGLAIETRETITMASFAAAKGKVGELCRVIRETYGAELPRRPARVEGAGIAFVWAGPDQWLALAERTGGRDLERELKPHLAGLASVVDQSDGRVVVRVSGPLAPEVLAKGVPIDLYPRAFGINGAAITHASHIGIIIWMVDDKPTYEMALFRSFADSFTHWLLESARGTVPAAG